MAARWERLAEDIRAKIRSGEYAADDKLPSYERLAQETGWSKGTVRMAIGILKVEGWVRGEPGAGVYVREDHPA